MELIGGLTYAGVGPGGDTLFAQAYWFTTTYEDEDFEHQKRIWEKGVEYYRRRKRWESEDKEKELEDLMK